MDDAARRARTFHRSISGSATYAASDTTATLVTVRNANSTIYIQRVIAYITTDAAQSWTFQDSNGTPVVVCAVTTSPGVNTRWDFDFGPRGKPLTEGKNFVISMSAAGLAGHIEWEGYSKITTAMAAGTTN